MPYVTVTRWCAATLMGLWLRPGMSGRGAAGLVLLLRLVLMQDMADMVAADGLAPAPGPVATIAVGEAAQLAGSGPFQCDQSPMCFGIDPSGTKVAALRTVAYPWAPAQLEVFAIPSGVRSTVDLSAHGEPIPLVQQLLWLDDHRLMLLGAGDAYETTCRLSDLGWTMISTRCFTALYALVDLTTNSVTTGSFGHDLGVVRMARTDDSRQVYFLAAQRSGSESTCLWDGSLSTPDYALAEYDTTTGAMTWHASQPDPGWLGTQDFAIRPDGTCWALLRITHGGDQGVEVLVSDLSAQPTVRRYVMPALILPHVAMRWGRDADHLDFQLFDDELSTVTLSLADGSWTQTPGWTLRRAHRLDPAGRDEAVVGLHALTLSDGRFVALLPRAIRTGDLFHLGYATTRFGLVDPVVADDALRFGVVMLGTCLRVIDLQHAIALSPAPGTIFDSQQGPRFLADGDLALTGNQSTFIVHDQGPARGAAFQEPVARVLAAAGNTLLAQTADEHLRIVDARTGLSRELPAKSAVQVATMSPDGRTALLRHGGTAVSIVHLDQQHTVWNMPCSLCMDGEMLGISWSSDQETCYLAEDAALGSVGACTGAWNIAEQRLAWRPQDAAGDEVLQAVALVPDPRGERILLQCRGHQDQQQRRMQAAIPLQSDLDANAFTCGLLDGPSGRWLGALANPGQDPGFTPDGQRVVGSLGVVGIAENRVLQSFAVHPRWWEDLWLSPSRTWVLWTPRTGAWELRDCAHGGIVVRIHPPTALDATEPISQIAWDPSEQHVAISRLLEPTVVRLALLPDALPQPCDKTVLARLDATTDWLEAARQLAGMGPAAVAALGGAALSAHRLIALEMLARAGVHQADGLLAHAAGLPLPLGYLAHDCAFRIQALRTQQALAAGGPRGPGAP